jgi:hypothetical protein
MADTSPTREQLLAELEDLLRTMPAKEKRCKLKTALNRYSFGLKLASKLIAVPPTSVNVRQIIKTGK